MRAALAAGTITAMVLSGAPLAVSAAQAAPVDKTVTKGQPKLPRKKLDKQLPKFVNQPRVHRSQAGYVVSADVRMRTWHTAHNKALRDRVKLKIDVAKKGVRVADVGLAKKSRKAGLMYWGTLKPVFVEKDGVTDVSITVPKKVGRSLAGQTLKQQRARVRLTVEHHKDARPGIPGRDVIQLAQSGQTEDSVRAKAASLSGNGQSTTSTSYLLNHTPYDAQAAVQGVNCVSDDQWTGSLPTNYALSYAFQVYTSGQAMANDFSGANTLSSDAIQALKQTAVQAAQSATTAGGALFTPAGAASAAVGWAEDFVGDFIKDLKADSCSSEPSLVTTSLVLTSWAAEEGQPYFPYYGLNTQTPTSPSEISFPSGFNTDSMNGAQSSTQWHWNGGAAVPAGPGSFNWAGGLISVAEGNSAGTNIIYLFESSSENPTGFGPAPAVWPPNSAIENSASLSATWNGSNMVLNCDPGEWNLFNPWGDSLAMTPGALSPANNNTYSSNQMFMQVAYSGTNQQGQQVYNEPFTGVQPLTAYSTETQAFTVDSAALQGITVDQWQCSIGASIQVQDWAIPSSWPTQYLTSTPNGSWWNAPNTVVTAPYVAP